MTNPKPLTQQTCQKCKMLIPKSWHIAWKGKKPYCTACYPWAAKAGAKQYGSPS